MGGEVILFILFVILILVAGIWGAIAARKRREALSNLAARLGLDFKPDKNHALASRFHFLDRLAQGANRYAFNLLHGRLKSHEVHAFDYHYETYSRDNKGRRSTHHHYFSCFVVTLPASFPELTITSEGIFSKIAQAIGYDDIDFESAEFSRRFCVRSKQKRFAYDVCHPRMMEHLLVNRDLSIEIENDALALLFGRRLDAAGIERNLARLIELRVLLPDYLFTRA
jgi:hypothetical protein